MTQPAETNDWAEALATVIIDKSNHDLNTKGECNIADIAAIIRTSAPARGDDELRRLLRGAQHWLCLAGCVDRLSDPGSHCEECKEITEALSRPASVKQQTRQPASKATANAAEIIADAKEAMQVLSGPDEMHEPGDVAEVPAWCQHYVNDLTDACRAKDAAIKSLLTLVSSPPAPQSQGEQPPEASELSFADLRTANVSRAAKWNANGVSIEFQAIELAGEAGEVCNGVKKLARLRMGMKGGSDTTANIAEELADTVICSDLLAKSLNIDLGQAVAAKFNATSEKHGFPDRLPQPPSSPASADVVKLPNYEEIGKWFWHNPKLHGRSSLGVVLEFVNYLRTRHPSPAEGKGPEGVVESKLANGETVQPEDFFK